MVSAQHVADSRRALAEGLVVREVVLVHSVEYPAVHGLETVAHIGQRTAYNDAHRVLYIACLHLADQLGSDYVLLGKCNVLRFVILILTTHFFSYAFLLYLYVDCVDTVSRLRRKPRQADSR